MSTQHSADENGRSRHGCGSVQDVGLDSFLGCSLVTKTETSWQPPDETCQRKRKSFESTGHHCTSLNHMSRSVLQCVLENYFV